MEKYLMKLEQQYFEDGLIGFLFAVVCILLTAFIISIILRKIILHRKINDQGNSKYYLRIKNMIVYGFAIYAILMQIRPLQQLGATLLASGGILAVVIGLAAQDALGNFVSGMIIMLFKPFKIGDLIKINNGEYVGTVVDLSMRHTIIETFEKTKVIIPNSEMNKAVLENVSRTGVKANFLDIDISYESNLEKAMKIMSEEIQKHPSFIDVRSEEEITAQQDVVIVRLLDFKDSSLHLRTTICSPDNATGYAMLSDLRIAIKKRFDQEGIVIPYQHVIIANK